MNSGKIECDDVKFNRIEYFSKQEWGSLLDMLCVCDTPCQVYEAARAHGRQWQRPRELTEKEIFRIVRRRSIGYGGENLHWFKYPGDKDRSVNRAKFPFSWFENSMLFWGYSAYDGERKDGAWPESKPPIEYFSGLLQRPGKQIVNWISKNVTKGWDL